MSGHEDFVECPECDGEMYSAIDYKPFSRVHGECLECGFCYFTKIGQNELEAVNKNRRECQLEPIEKLRAKTLKLDEPTNAG